MTRDSASEIICALCAVCALSSGLFFTGQQLTLFSIAAVAVLVAATTSLLTRKALWLPWAWLPFVAFVFWSALSTIWTSAVFPTLIAAFVWASLPLFSWMASQWPRKGAAWEVCVVLGVICGLSLVAVQTLQWWQGMEPSGPFLNRNSLAAFLSLLLFLCAGSLVFRNGYRTVLGLGVTCVLAYGIGVTGSRGVLVGLVCGGAVAMAGAWSGATARRALAWLGFVVLGLVVANLVSQGGLGWRLESLATPVAAGTQRFVIWRGVLKMISHAPNLGYGAGTFWLAYPPFRSVQDASGGFYAHNDYLQALAELGWPGLLLLVTSLAGVGHILVRTLRLGRSPGVQGVEAVALGGGIAACAVHSLFSFNFYILPTVMLFGLMLGRLLALGSDIGVVGGVVIRPGCGFSSVVWRVVVVLTLLIPLSYFVALGSGHHLYNVARGEAERGQLISADKTLQQVARLLPNSDAPRLARAGLFQTILRRNPHMPEADRRALLEAALSSLAAAQRVNPLRPDPLVMQGEMISENPELAGSAGSERVVGYFRKALRLDPLYVRARMDLATYLQQAKNDPQGARRVLEAGVDYMYPPREYVLRYLHRVADLREASGDQQGALELKDRIKRYSESLSKEKNKSGRQNWWERPVTPDAIHSS